MARRGWRGYSRGSRKELSPTGGAVGRISHPEQRGLWERSSAPVEGAVGEIPHFGQRGLWGMSPALGDRGTSSSILSRWVLWEGSPALVRRGSGKGFLTELPGLWEEFCHHEWRTVGRCPSHPEPGSPILSVRDCGKDAPTAGIGGLKKRGTSFVGRFSLLLSWKTVANSIVPSRGQRAWEGPFLLSGRRLQ